MRHFGDRERNQYSKKWDEDVPYIEIGPRGRVCRLVGPVQDIAVNWVMVDAKLHVDNIRKAKKEASRRGISFKEPREGIAFPVLNPRYDIFREKFVDYRDPETGDGWQTKEVLTAKTVRAKGIKLPPDCDKVTARFSPRCLETGNSVELVRVHDPLKEDFNRGAQVRTYWHAIDRETQKKNKGAGCVGVVNKGGFPITAYRAIERISEAIECDPSDPDKGYDLRFVMDKKAASPGDMWDVRHLRESPLTPAERKMVFGSYKLKSGKIVDFNEVVRMRREEPKKLKGMKTLSEAALMPLDEMASQAVISGDELKETLVRCGWYDEDGKPYPELILPDKKARKDDWDEDDYEDDYEDDEDHPKKKKNHKHKIKPGSKAERGNSKKKGSNSKKSRVIDDDIQF